jgi:hypothetical protein
MIVEDELKSIIEFWNKPWRWGDDEPNFYQVGDQIEALAKAILILLNEREKTK